MVNRTKISREIRRRTGGTGQYKPPTAAEVRAASKNLAPNINETFIHKGKKISAWVKDKTKPISGRGGTIGYQRKLHPEFRKQKQATVKRTKDKKEEAETVTTDTKTNLERLLGRAKETRPRYDLEQAARAGSKKAEEERKREEARTTRKKEVKETPFGLKAVRGRAMLSPSAKEDLKTRKKFRQERIADAARSAAPVTRTDLPPPPKVITTPPAPKKPEPSYSKIAHLELQKELAKERAEIEAAREAAREADEEFHLSREKTGGKVSRSKGGKVSRKKSKKGKKVSWNGNSEVSRWYD